MAVRDISESTWEELRALDPAGTVALLPIGALEAHGPHLPLSTDVLIAEAMVAEGARRLGQRGLEVISMPALAYTAAGFAAGFPGTVDVRPETVTALLVDVAASLARHGVGTLAFASAHLDPSHRACLQAAREEIARRGLLVPVFPDLASRRWAGRLGEEFGSGACHAGRFEGSVVMAVRPDLVREELQRSLPPVPASLSAAIQDGKTSFHEAGAPRAYCGWPADATADEGRATIETLGAILEEAVLASLPGPAEPDA
jgi:creatinine amidohydrolase